MADYSQIEKEKILIQKGSVLRIIQKIDDVLKPFDTVEVLCKINIIGADGTNEPYVGIEYRGEPAFGVQENACYTLKLYPLWRIWWELVTI